ncbi:hypothetical protein GCM10009716_25310 [Streptomyces sodiiphilus]|uniref:DUF4352 domain-containing protein n=1 Tax=Streptomyces sodiiphilus TaxID=226217 RepID=A0ABN2P9J6_9ACTN
MAEQETTEQPFARVRRRRVRALAAAAAVVLATGALAACEPETPAPAPDVVEGGEGGGPGEGGDAADRPGADDGFLAAGETQAWDNGVEITLSAAEEYTPSDHIEVQGTAWKVTVTVHNGGDSDYLASLLYSARAGDRGGDAAQIYDSALLERAPDGAVKPGRSMTGEIAFDVPDGAGFVDVEVNPVGGGLDKAYWNLRL